MDSVGHMNLVSFVPMEVRSQVVHLRHRKRYSILRNAANGHDPVEVFDRLRCIFVHIPKTAGKSVKSALFDGRTKGGHRSAYELMCIFGPITYYRYFRFAFVRNPYDRLASAYYFLRNGGINDKDRAFAENHLYRYDNLHDFVMNWLDMDNIQIYHHFKPQHQYIYTRRHRCLVDMIGRYETLGHDFERICNRLGIAASLPHHNKTSVYDQQSCSYEPSSKRKIRDIYKLDFELLGYSY